MKNPKTRPNRKTVKNPDGTFICVTTPLAGVIKHVRISIERVATWSHPAGYNHPPRIASEAILKYVETGTATMHFAGRTINVKPGDLIFLPRLMPLHYRVGAGISFLHHTIHFTMENGEAVHLENLDLMPACVNLGRTSDVPSLFEKLKALLPSDHPSAYYECLSLFFNLLSRMCRAGRDSSPDSSTQTSKAHQALHIISEQYTRKLTVEQIARRLNITPEYLSTFFRETFGVTPKTQIRNFRLQRAADLLWTTDLSVKEVAHAVGYQSTSTFDRAFRKLHGYSPSEYRTHLVSATKSGVKMPYRRGIPPVESPPES